MERLRIGHDPRFESPGHDAASTPQEAPPILGAGLQVYRLYDLADALDLARARECLDAPLIAQRPVVSRGASIEIPQLPVAVSLGTADVPLHEAAGEARLEGRLYDLGIVALSLHVPLVGPVMWAEAADLLANIQGFPSWISEPLNMHIGELRTRLLPALSRPNVTVREEDYVVFVVDQLGPGAPASQLARHPDLLQAALGERKRLSPAAASLATSLSYYEDDLILLTWNTAIVIDPDEAARRDAAFLLEFANAQLLAFRTYDAQVDADLAALTPRIARIRRIPWPLTYSSRRSLSEVHGLIADITATSTRVENALRVTEDVYWNRVYAAALAVLRVDVFRAEIADGLRVLRETASLLHNEAEATWSSLLEVLVVVLIAIELLVAILGLR